MEKTISPSSYAVFYGVHKAALKLLADRQTCVYFVLKGRELITVSPIPVEVSSQK